MDIALWADGLARNLRHAARSLGRAPGFALTVVATLALGIGANTAVFGALDAVLLRPLPFPDADRLVRLSQTQQTSSETMIAPVRLEEWNRLNSTFSAISGYGVEDVSETSGDLPERVRRAFVTPRLLEVWGVAPALGRGFSEEEHRFGGPAAALVSDRYWRSRLGSSARRAVAQRPNRKRVGADRGSDARLLPLPRSGRGRLVPLAGGRALRPVASQHLVHGRGPPAPGRDPGAGAGGSFGRAGSARAAVPRPRPEGRRRASAAQAGPGRRHRPRALAALRRGVGAAADRLHQHRGALRGARGVPPSRDRPAPVARGVPRRGRRRSCWPRRSCSRSWAGPSGCWSPASPRPRSAPSGPSCRAWTRWWWTAGSCSTAR